MRWRVSRSSKIDGTSIIAYIKDTCDGFPFGSDRYTKTNPSASPWRGGVSVNFNNYYLYRVCVFTLRAQYSACETRVNIRSLANSRKKVRENFQTAQICLQVLVLYCAALSCNFNVIFITVFLSCTLTASYTEKKNIFLVWEISLVLTCKP